MNIRQRMLLGAAALTLIPVALTSLLLWQGASNLSSETVGSQVRTQLVSLRDTKQIQVRDELEDRIKSLQVLAAQRSTIDAYKQLKSGFYTADKDLAKLIDTAGAAKNVTDYAGLFFNTEYAKRNPGVAPSLANSIA